MSGSDTSRTRADQPLLRSLLRDVSRSFYLTLRILPKPIRPQIGLAYLLARATDTIADTGAVPVEKRLEALRHLRDAILAKEGITCDLPLIRTHQSSPAEKVLLERIHEALALLNQFHPADQRLIRTVLQTIVEGQELDLVRFGGASGSAIVALETDTQLDDYTYRVAGCVGEFWTRMCLAHLKSPAKPDLEAMVELGIRFGKGLQLVNVLRDLPADLRNGRCYLPWPALHLLGLRPGDLLDKDKETQLRPVYNEWLHRAEGHLHAGWQYVLSLPRGWWRLRLACAWPVLIGLQTLDRLSTGNVLNADTRIKVSRAEIKKIVRQTIFLYPFSASWGRLPERLRGRG